MLIPGAKHPIGDAKARVEFLIKDIHGSGQKILIPTPALSEILIKSGKAKNEILQLLSKATKFEIGSFDLRAALELSVMSDAAFTSKDKKDGATGTWVKIKFDRQIVAISKVAGASKIYSEDEGLRRVAAREGLTALGVAEIQIPMGDQFGPWGEGEK